MKKDISKKIDKFIDEKILSQPLEQIMDERFARYSKYIIQERALPDARDGLKPVQRRIFYAMRQMGMYHNKPYKKSARIVGDVMGKYHPHGDSSIYEAMVRLSQDFKMNTPLIDMHGNNGSIDGDSAAAMRYTESRLTLAAEQLLLDIDKRTVTFVPNFDDEELEPTVLPARFPNLLVNGGTGIAAGYATKIPPHNLGEIIDCTIALLKKPTLSNEEMLEIIKGPDFPTGAIVYSKEGIDQALQTGTGKVIIRAKTIIEEISKAQERIVITEIPYEVNKADLCRSIDALRIDKKVEDILEVRDETDKDGLRIAIDLKKGSETTKILNYLYKTTDLQTTYNYNMVTIINHRPLLVGVIPILSAYIQHQKDVITNRSNYDLEKCQTRLHIVEGLIKMVSVLDEVIKIIRNSDNKSNAKENLIQRFSFTELQAEAIVMLQLYRLTNTDVVFLTNEAADLNKKIGVLQDILANEKTLIKLIIKELEIIKGLINTPRRTQIFDNLETIKVDPKELISEEQIYVAITKDGYVKKTSIKSFSQSTTPGLKENDSITFFELVSSLDTLLLFTNQGNYIFLPIHKIDEQKWKDLGIYISNIVLLNKGETILSTYNIKNSNFNTPDVFLIASQAGYLKQVKLNEFSVTRFNKLYKAMKLANDDFVVSVSKGPLERIVALTVKGYATNFSCVDIPFYGTTAGGVKSVSSQDGDKVASVTYVSPNDQIAILTARGHIIKELVRSIPETARNRRGVLLIERLKTNPHLVTSITRLSSNQDKENVDVKIISRTKAYDLKVSDLKYSQSRFGKQIVADLEPLNILISNAINDIEGDLDALFKLQKLIPTLNELSHEIINNNTISTIKQGITSDKATKSKLKTSESPLLENNESFEEKKSVSSKTEMNAEEKGELTLFSFEELQEKTQSQNNKKRVISRLDDLDD